MSITRLITLLCFVCAFALFCFACSDKYAFSCHFYTGLASKESGREIVRTMTKHVNIFEKELIFIPINKVCYCKQRGDFTS
jgi:hypothetical protein